MDPDSKKGDDGLSPMAQQMRSAQPYLDAVWKLVGGVGLGVLSGYFLDRIFSTKPLFLLGLSLLGGAIGFYGFIRAALLLTGKKSPP